MTYELHCRDKLVLQYLLDKLWILHCHFRFDTLLQDHHKLDNLMQGLNIMNRNNFESFSLTTSILTNGYKS